MKIDGVLKTSDKGDGATSTDNEEISKGIYGRLGRDLGTLRRSDKKRIRIDMVYRGKVSFTDLVTNATLMYHLFIGRIEEVHYFSSQAKRDG